MKKIALGISTAALGLTLLAAPVLAQQHHMGAPGGHSSGGWTHGSSGGHGNPGAWAGHSGSWHGAWHNGWHGSFHTFGTHDFAHFSVADRHVWVGGHWWHGPWHGRNGWWWFAGGGWYFYPVPVYPYPLYVSDYYVDDDYYDYPDDAGAQGGYSWYYCKNPPGYYPYIQNCNGPWQPVPAGAPPGYQSGSADQGPPPGYNDGPNGQDGPPPGYEQGPGGNPPPPSNGR